jgi:hypothetical protein
MPDLSRLFAVARTQAREAILTAGITVQVETRVEGATLTDPDTVTVEATHPAIIAPNTDLAPTGVLPGVELKTTDWKVLLLPEVPPPAHGKWVRCLTAPHPALVGRSARVVGHGVDPSGSVTVVYARPEVTG